MMRVLTPEGAIFYNHKWRVQKGLLQDRTDIVDGFPVRQIIIWQRSGGFNHNPGYFLPTYEVVYLIAKPGFRLAPKAGGVGDVWRIRQDRGNPHPASFPVDLAQTSNRGNHCRNSPGSVHWQRHHRRRRSVGGTAVHRHRRVGRLLRIGPATGGCSGVGIGENFRLQLRFHRHSRSEPCCNPRLSLPRFQIPTHSTTDGTITGRFSMK